jgi:hypothetical protein
MTWFTIYPRYGPVSKLFNSNRQANCETITFECLNCLSMSSDLFLDPICPATRIQLSFNPLVRFFIQVWLMHLEFSRNSIMISPSIARSLLEIHWLKRDFAMLVRLWWIPLICLQFYSFLTFYRSGVAYQSVFVVDYFTNWSILDHVAILDYLIGWTCAFRPKWHEGHGKFLEIVHRVADESDDDDMISRETRSDSCPSATLLLD